VCVLALDSVVCRYFFASAVVFAVVLLHRYNLIAVSLSL